MTQINVRVTLDFSYEAKPKVTPETIRTALAAFTESLVRQGWADLESLRGVELATPVSLGVFTRYDDHTKNQPYAVTARPLTRIYRSPDAPPPYPASRSPRKRPAR